MKKKKQDILKKSIIRSLLLLLATISLIIGLLITVEALTSNKEKKEALLNYEKRGKIDYVVNLKENDLYNDSSIEEENVISKYIESIKANFKYEFSSSKNLDSDATYILKLTLVNSYNSNAQKETLLEKEYELMPESNIKSNNKGVIFFEKEIEINYDEYNQIAKRLEKSQVY